MIKLIHGDCLEEMDKLAADGAVIDAVITDIPYGVTDCSWDVVIPFDAMWERLNKLIKPNGAIVLFGIEPFSSALRMSNIRNYRYDWVWVKDQGTGFLLYKKQPLRNNEQISIFYTQQSTYNPQMRSGFEPYFSIRTQSQSIGGQIYGKGKNNNITVVQQSQGLRYPLNTLYFGKDRTIRLHPSQKPLALMGYLVCTYTNKDEIVLDFTMGSGTTGAACKKLGRDFIGIEQNEAYYNAAKKRIENIADQQPKGVVIS